MAKRRRKKQADNQEPLAKPIKNLLDLDVLRHLPDSVIQDFVDKYHKGEYHVPPTIHRHTTKAERKDLSSAEPETDSRNTESDQS